MTCWAFAAETWARPGAAARFLALQNDHGQSAALLLWALWTVRHGAEADDAVLAAGARLARTWEDQIIGPLRAVRGRLAAPAWPVDRQVPPLRARVLDAEVAAERALLEGLEALTPARGDAVGRIDPLERLAKVSALWRPPAPAAPLDGLAAAVAAAAGP